MLARTYFCEMFNGQANCDWDGSFHFDSKVKATGFGWNHLALKYIYTHFYIYIYKKWKCDF